MKPIIIICKIKNNDKYLVNGDNTPILFFVDLEKMTPIMGLKDYLKNNLHISLSIYNKTKIGTMKYLENIYNYIFYDILEYSGNVNPIYKFINENNIYLSEEVSKIWD